MTDEIKPIKTKRVKLELSLMVTPVIYADITKELLFKYKALSSINNNWPGRTTVDGQRLLCELRDQIATMLNVEPQVVQDSDTNVLVDKVIQLQNDLYIKD